jgi:hypothetical protein
MRNAFKYSAFVILAMTAAPMAVAESNGPIFGIATAPNGDVLVGDAGAGIVNDDTGALIQSLPGITDIAPIGTSSLWVTRNGTNPLADSGQALLRVSKGKSRVIANLFAFEETYNPEPAKVESNPFDVYALGGEYALVADAAGNDLLRVDSEGVVELLAVFPTTLVSTLSLKAALGCPGSGLPLCFVGDMMPAEAVPTSVAVGPDGFYYVGELRGFPGPLGHSRIWRVAPWASAANCGSSPDCQVVFEGGFTSIIDLAFGPDGLLYVVEFDENGWFAAEVLDIQAGGTINACDIDTHDCVVVETGISYPTAITFGKRGELYATENAIIPPLASVIEIQ